MQVQEFMHLMLKSQGKPEANEVLAQNIKHMPMEEIPEVGIEAG